MDLYSAKQSSHSSLQDAMPNASEKDSHELFMPLSAPIHPVTLSALEDGMVPFHHGRLAQQSLTYRHHDGPQLDSMSLLSGGSGHIGDANMQSSNLLGTSSETGNAVTGADSAKYQRRKGKEAASYPPLGSKSGRPPKLVDDETAQTMSRKDLGYALQRYRQRSIRELQNASLQQIPLSQIYRNPNSATSLYNQLLQVRSERWPDSYVVRRHLRLQRSAVAAINHLPTPLEPLHNIDLDSLDWSVLSSPSHLLHGSPSTNHQTTASPDSRPWQQESLASSSISNPWPPVSVHAASINNIPIIDEERRQEMLVKAKERRRLRRASMPPKKKGRKQVEVDYESVKHMPSEDRKRFKAMMRARRNTELSAAQPHDIHPTLDPKSATYAYNRLVSQRTKPMVAGTLPKKKNDRATRKRKDDLDNAKVENWQQAHRLPRDEYIKVRKTWQRRSTNERNRNPAVRWENIKTSDTYAYNTLRANYKAMNGGQVLDRLEAMTRG